MLSDIFTKKNIEILQLILDRELHIRDIADELKCSPAKVHNAVKVFKKYNLVLEKEKKNKKIIIPNHDSKLLKKIKELFELEKEVKVSAGAGT